MYSNHVEQVTEQLSREPFPFPSLILKKASSMFSYDFDDVLVESYEHHPAIKAPRRPEQPAGARGRPAGARGRPDAEARRPDGRPAGAGPEEVG